MIAAVAPLELAALGLGGLAAVVAVGAAVAAYSTRRALRPGDGQAGAEPPR